MKYSIEKLAKNDYDSFADMFVDYFINDMGVKYDASKLKEGLVKNTILKQYEKKIIFIDIIKTNKLCGFIIYQIDAPTSDWNERPGCGYIREFYVSKDCRNNGLGSQLLANAEKTLKSAGVKSVYLTSSENDLVKKFYVKNAYVSSNVRCAANDLEIYEKML